MEIGIGIRIGVRLLGVRVDKIEESDKLRKGYVRGCTENWVDAEVLFQCQKSGSLTKQLRICIQVN